MPGSLIVFMAQDPSLCPSRNENLQRLALARVSNSEMRDFFVELVEHHNSQMSYAKSRRFLAGAAQGFSPRRTE